VRGLHTSDSLILIILYTLEDVGVPKVVTIKKFLEKICPDKTMLTADSRVQMYNGDPEKDGDMLEYSNSTMILDF